MGLAPGFVTLSFFPASSVESCGARRDPWTRQQDQGFIFSLETFETARLSLGEDTPSFSQCQQEQEARCVLCVVTRLIYALARGPSSRQSPAFHLAGSRATICTNDVMTAFGETVLNRSKVP